MIARLRTRLGSVPPALVTIVSILFLNNVAVAAARALLPIYVESDLGMPPAFTSLLVSLETVMGGLISVTAGAWADRLGHRLVLVIGILGFSAGLLQFLTGAPWLLVALAVILGLAHGMRSTSGQSYLLSAASRQSVGVATAAYFLGGTIGMAASSAVAGPVVERFGFGAYALVGLGLNLVPAAITLRYLTDVRPKRPVGGIDEGTWNVLMRREVWLMGGLRFFSTAFWGVWSLALPLLMFRATASVLPPALLYGTVGMSLAAVSQFLVGHWSDRRGRAGPVFAVLSLQVVVSAIAALAWQATSLMLTITGIAGVVTGWTMSVLVLGVVRDRTAPLERGRVVGFVHALWSFGILAGYVIAGTLLNIDPTLPLGLGVLANAAALAIAVWLFQGRRATEPVSAT